MFQCRLNPDCKLKPTSSLNKKMGCEKFASHFFCRHLEGTLKATASGKKSLPAIYSPNGKQIAGKKKGELKINFTPQ